MKKIFFIMLSLPFFMFSQTATGKMKVQLKDKLTGLPIISAEILVTLNDSIKLPFTSDSQGWFLIGNLKGLYNLEVACGGYKTIRKNGIVIGEEKTAYIMLYFTPARPLTKKEKDP